MPPSFPPPSPAVSPQRCCCIACHMHIRHLLTAGPDYIVFTCIFGRLKASSVMQNATLNKCKHKKCVKCCSFRSQRSKKAIYIFTYELIGGSVDSRVSLYYPSAAALTYLLSFLHFLCKKKVGGKFHHGLLLTYLDT